MPLRAVPQNYEEAVAYIGDLPRFTRKHPLSHTRELMRRLGNPAAEGKIIHVAGTNGKGSVCVMLGTILMTEGKRVGLFTSPHLVRINERIRLDGKPISDEAFFQVFRRVQRVAAEMEAENKEHPTYFEFLYAMAMCAFADADVEYLILETGLGGRLDATNVNAHPILTVITSISLDHTRYLGDTVEEIAAEKAGILKPGVPLILDDSDPVPAAVIERIARERGVLYLTVNRQDFQIREADRNRVTFSRLHTDDPAGMIWQIPSGGLYQVINAGLALAAADTLFCDTWSPAEEAKHKDLWADALANLPFEGRMEEAAPHLMLDGAHNPAAVRAFCETVWYCGEDLIKDAQPVILFSAVKDKQYEEMIRILCDEAPARAYIVTKISDERGLSAEKLADIFRGDTEKPVYCIPDLADALRKAFEIRGDGEVYCLGSLYLVGMVKKLLIGGQKND